MSPQPRLTPQTARVLDALIAQPSQAGADLARATGLKTGTLYPILIRLEEAGWLRSTWESQDPSTLGRPRRRLYQVTAAGLAHARDAAATQQQIYGRLAW